MLEASSQRLQVDAEVVVRLFKSAYEQQVSSSRRQGSSRGERCTDTLKDALYRQDTPPRRAGFKPMCDPMCPNEKGKPSRRLVPAGLCSLTLNWEEN